MNDNPTYEELEQKNRELKRQLVEYKQLAAHFRCIFRAIPDATVFADTDRRISTINPSFVRKFGYEEEELLGRDTSIVYSSKEDYEEQGRIRFNLTVKEKLKPYKMDYRKKSGEIFPAEVVAATVKDDDGNAMGFLGILRDITERKQAEQELQESESNLKAAQKIAHVGSWDLDVVTGNLTWSDETYRIYGFEPQEFVPTYEKFLSILHPEDHERVQKHVDAALSGEVEYGIDFRFMRPDGKIGWIYCVGEVTRDAQGKPLRFLGTQIDITERKLAEEALQKAHSELEQRVRERTVELQKTHEQLLHVEKLSAIGNLSASIAHEFNNPLQGVMTVIKGVKRRSTLDEEDAKLMEMAVNECDRMKDLIKSLQDFNRPSSGRVAPMNIHATIDSLLLLSKKEYKTKGITVETNYAEDMPQIKAVADQIKQVLLNLFNNAAYACEGGGTVTINTEVVSKENIAIKIKDTGKGVKPEHMDKIFEPFFTSKPEIKGTGLGLSVSYGIIKKHGGRIEVESEPDKRTTFTITLPIAGVNSAEQVNPAG